MGVQAMTAIVPAGALTRDQAVMLDMEVRWHDFQFRRKLYEFYHKDAWRVLGYASFEQYCTESLPNVGYKQALKYVKAGAVAVNEPSGLFDTIPVKGGEQLAKLPDPDDRRAAWERASKLALQAGRDTPTVDDLRTAVERMKTERAVEAGNVPLITADMHAGHITPDTAAAMLDALTDLPPQATADTLSLMQQHRIRDAQVFATVAQLAARPDRDDSKVWGEITTSGTVGGTPLTDAARADVREANRLARREHLDDALHEELARAELIAHVITVYGGKDAERAAQRTVKALREALPDNVLTLVKEGL